MTNKTIIIIRGQVHEDYFKFKERILNWANQTLVEVPKLKVALTAERPPNRSVIPFNQNRLAAVSIYSSDINPSDIMDIPGYAGFYQVSEALPVQYHKDWEDHLPTPGVCLLTIFRKKPRLDREMFLRKWHQGHTPLSLQIHPLWNYNRNVVESFAEGSEPFDGIVEEQFKFREDLLNPIKFFGGNPLLVPFRMLQVYFDVRSFLDYKSIQTFWAEEVYVRS